MRKKTLTRGKIDRRSVEWQFIQAWMKDLVRDLGGAEGLTTVQRTVINTAARTKLYMDKLDEFLITKHSMTDKVLTRWALEQRTKMALNLSRNLERLGKRGKKLRAPVGG